MRNVPAVFGYLTPIMRLLMHIPFIYQITLCFANVSLKVTSVAMYCTVHSSADVMTDNMSSHQRSRFRLTFSNRKKALFYGSSCNPSSGIFFFFL